MNYDVENDDRDKGSSTVAPCLRIRHKVAEAHDRCERGERDALIERLQGILEFLLEWLHELEHDDEAE